MKEKIFGYYREAIIIREVEETFLRMFSEGKLNGTVHTCIGQELSAVSVCNNLSDKDFVVSNHRCHGHYIAFKKDIKGLIAELMGKKSGICGGIGSSQHIYNKNFLSNGIQGGIVPIAAGIAFSKKLKNENGIAVVFIGDGTLGEGAVYETMNIISLLELPILIVCENNLYAQSTYISENMSGSILNRAKSFNLNTFECETFDVEQLFSVTESAVDFVRIKRKPAFCLINTYRLSAHSKGDDNRDKEEILNYEKRDPVNIFKEKHKDEYTTYFNEAVQLINTVFKSIENDCNLNFVEYKDTNLTNNKIEWKNYNPSGGKYSDSIYTFLSNSLNNTENTVILGEDIHSPYGGAFKITRDLSDIFPSRVISTPISESAITGLSNGLAISGFRPILEIMFGDFITLALDQIINHASKFYHMYNKQINCPLIVRTPMGGRRGYGPTHSQSLENLLYGIDNTTLISLNRFYEPKEIYNSLIMHEKHPVFVIENKTDYGKKISQVQIENYCYEISDEKYPTIKIRPLYSKPDIVIVTYGGISSIVAECVDELINLHEIIPVVYVLSKLYPLDVIPFIKDAEYCRNIIIVEECKKEGGVGNHIIMKAAEIVKNLNFSLVIGSVNLPIPSVRELEEEVLPGKARIIKEIVNKYNEN